ncbi:MAG TPA: hypothetical protein VNQ99_07480 [Xanthobacteraceae bacterium]|nr:hypothetical protein [Xanthobacteraceae bacterium]
MTDSRQPSSAALVTAFAFAATLGLLAAMAVHVALTGSGVGLGNAWQQVFPASGALVRSAIAWWAIAAAGFLVSHGAGRIFFRSRPGWEATLILAGLAFVGLLAWTGHGASGALTRSASLSLSLHFIVLLVGGAMAAIGAYAALAGRDRPVQTDGGMLTRPN